MHGAERKRSSFSSREENAIRTLSSLGGRERMPIKRKRVEPLSFFSLALSLPISFSHTRADRLERESEERARERREGGERNAVVVLLKEKDRRDSLPSVFSLPSSFL